MKIGLVGEDYSSRSPAVSAQTCINVFPALIDDPNESSTTQSTAYNASAQGKNKGVLYGCPGKHLFKALSAPPRGLWSGGGRLFVVAGLNEIELSSTGTILSSNAIAATNDGLPVGIFSNGNQLMIVTGGLAFCDNGAGPVAITTDNYAGVVGTLGFGNAVIWNSGDKFLTDGSWTGTTITINFIAYTIASVFDDEHIILTGAAPIAGPYLYSHLGIPLTAISGAVLDSTFFVQRPPGPGPGGPSNQNLGAQVNFSAVLDGTNWTGLNFFTKESYADNLRSIFTDNEQLYLWGTQTFEVWQSDPNATVDGNPFVRIPGASGRFGNISTWGCDHIDGHIFFVGGDDRGGTVAYVMNGFTPVRISNHAIEAEWKTAGLGPNCVTYAYMEEGHSFFVINFGSQTWAYEAETGAWHQRAKWSGSAFTPYNTNLHTYISEWGGLHLTACSTGTNDVYSSSTNFYDDEGGNIAWQRALPYIYNAGMWTYFGRMTLELETGSGTTPVITFDYSDDRGATYPNARASAVGNGDTDANANRVFWLRSGKSRGRIVRLSGVGQYRIALIDLECDLTMGTV
jgi:hypothetical protein